MTVCKFFLQGSCKYGNQCRFEHVRPSGQQGFNSRGSAGSSNQQQPAMNNRGGFQSGRGRGYHQQGSGFQRVSQQSGFTNQSQGGGYRGGHVGRGRGSNHFRRKTGDPAANLQQLLVRNIERLDFTSLAELASPSVQQNGPVAPSWPFTCFGPGSELPNMVTGCELSAEEHRWEVYQVERGIKTDSQVVLLLQCLASRLDGQISAIRQSPEEALRRYKEFYTKHSLGEDFDILANGPLDPVVKDPMSHQELVFNHFKPPQVILTNILLSRPPTPQMTTPQMYATNQIGLLNATQPLPSNPNGVVINGGQPNSFFAAQQQPQQPVQVPVTNLGPMEVEQFSADRFHYLRVPESEPPVEFR